MQSMLLHLEWWFFFPVRLEQNMEYTLISHSCCTAWGEEDASDVQLVNNPIEVQISRFIFFLRRCFVFQVKNVSTHKSWLNILPNNKKWTTYQASASEPAPSFPIPSPENVLRDLPFQLPPSQSFRSWLKCHRFRGAVFNDPLSSALCASPHLGFTFWLCLHLLFVYTFSSH